MPGVDLITEESKSEGDPEVLETEEDTNKHIEAEDATEDATENATSDQQVTTESIEVIEELAPVNIEQAPETFQTEVKNAVQEAETSDSDAQDNFELATSQISHEPSEASDHSDLSLAAYGDGSDDNESLAPEAEVESPVPHTAVITPSSSKLDVKPASLSPISPPLPPREKTVQSAKSPSNEPQVPPVPPPREEPVQSAETSSSKPHVHAVPPPLSEELKSDTFRKSMMLTSPKALPPALPPRSRHNRSGSADFDLVINRIQEYEEEYLAKDDHAQGDLQEGVRILKSSYTAFLETINPDNEIPQDHEEHRELIKIDWPFWTRLVNDYAEVAKKDSVKLEKEVTAGIPPQVRGIIWQLMANTKSRGIEEIYAALKVTESAHEKAIQRDISRTKYIPENKTESLFNVLKAYSIYDEAVGYTQGMAFIATAMLLNVETEAEAFGLLISLMKGYGLRELFLPEMPGLHLKLYQFDRLLEENAPSLYNHLARQGVRSSMYASQWFLTCFAYRFPLCFVLRVFDIIFVEGIEAILRFAVVLMIRNEKTLVSLQFDKLLEFLKDELFAYYLKDSVKKRQAAKGESTSALSLLSRKSSQNKPVEQVDDEDYAIDAFVEDAMSQVKITPITLKRYIAEYEEIHLLESQKEAQLESLRIKNKQLHNEVRKLERDHTALNREHIAIANELIENRLAFETLQDENRDLLAEVARLKTQLKDEIRKQSLPNPDAELPTDLKADLQETMARNLEVMNQNQELQDRLTQLEQEVRFLKSGSSREQGTAAGQKSPNLGNWKGLKKVWK